MTANKNASRRTLKSDLARVDAHKVQPHEYDDAPELTAAALQRGNFRHAGRPLAEDPRQQVTIRLPASVLKRWRASGAGWQTRMATVLEHRAP